MRRRDFLAAIAISPALTAGVSQAAATEPSPPGRMVLANVTMNGVSLRTTKDIVTAIKRISPSTQITVTNILPTRSCSFTSQLISIPAKHGKVCHLKVYDAGFIIYNQVPPRLNAGVCLHGWQQLHRECEPFDVVGMLRVAWYSKNGALRIEALTPRIP